MVGTTQSRPPRALLVEWANQNDGWVRSIVSEVLVSRTAPGPEVLRAVKDVFYAEKRLSADPYRMVAPLTVEERTSNEKSTLRLLRIADCKNVNRLAPTQQIEFGSRLTLLFGENATGKTGYVRILKRISGVRGASRVLPDIETTGTPDPPEARIEYELDGAQETRDWKDEVGISPFTRIAVFDSPAVSIHLTENLDYVFTPADLSLFEMVHTAIGGVRQAISDDVAERRRPASAYLTRFTIGTPSYAIIEGLSGSTSPDDLKAASVSAEDKEAIRSLQLRIDALKPETNRSTLRIMQNRLRVAEQIESTVAQLTQFDASQHASQLQSMLIAENSKAAEAAAVGDETSELAPLQWQRLLESAESYVHATRSADYPHEHDNCVYCRQPLSNDAVELLQNYRRFAAGQADQLLTQLTAQVRQSFAPIRNAGATQVQSAYGTLGAEGLGVHADVESEIRTILRSTAELHELGERSTDPRLAELATQCARLQRLLATLTEELRANIADASANNQERQDLLSAAEQELRERKDQVTLSELLPELLEFVSDAKWCDQAEMLLRRFQGILKTLTETSKSASQRALQQDFEKHFEVERSALRAPKVQINFPGRQGRTTRSKTVSPQYNLDAVLSEGEQKVIALADFLAEGLMRAGSAPIVFDDPVNSLDYRRLHEVVDRIVSLSQEHQVIVFSHNIWFTSELLARFERDKDSFRYYEIQEIDGQKGIVTAGSGPRVDTHKQISKAINELIDEAKKRTGTIRHALIESAYEALRNWCELFVEQDLLSGVTERYSPHVGVTRIRNLRPDRMREATEVIVPIYEKCCRQIKSHSQPRETLNVRATLEELEDEWKAASAARSAYLAT